MRFVALSVLIGILLMIAWPYLVRLAKKFFGTAEEVREACLDDGIDRTDKKSSVGEVTGGIQEEKRVGDSSPESEKTTGEPSSPTDETKG